MKPLGGIGSVFLVSPNKTSGHVLFRCERSQKWWPNITVIEREPHGIVPNLTGFVRVRFPKSESTGQRVVISSMKLFENSKFVQPLVS